MKTPSAAVTARLRDAVAPRATPHAFAPSRRKWTSPTAHICGLASFMFGVGTVVSGLVGLGYDDPDSGVLIWYGVVCAALGAVLWRNTGVPARMSRLSAFFTVSATWAVIALVAALPYLLVGTFDSLVDAWFESVAGLTSVGSTVLGDIEAQGKGVLFYRQYTQFFGGGGIVLLAVAIIQNLGVGGLDLAETETAGPSAEGQIAPRVATVARRLWTVYVGMVLAIAAALFVAGVGPYDAITHAMTTIPTAGFSTFSDSISHFDSQVVELIIIVGMVMGATNISLHYRAIHGGPTRYLRSPEFRFFMTLLASAIAAVTLLNVTDGMPLLQALRESSFNVTTVITTTGYGTTDFTTWLPAAQIILLCMMFVGGMAGSTAGGLKVIRLRVLIQFVWREIKRVRFPRGVFVIRLGKERVRERIVSDIATFAMLYFLAIATATIVLTFLGTDLMTSLGGVAATITTVGPGLGDVGPHSNFLVFSEPGRVVLSFMMLLGRMEIVALLLAFVVPYRRLKGALRAMTP